MPDVPPPIFTDPASWATYLAAVKQADAAIEAANIAAQATWDTALCIGVPTALAALFAAGLTYMAAIKAAKQQVKLETDKHEARVTAYAVRQWHLIQSAITFTGSAKHFNSEVIQLIEKEELTKERFRNLVDFIVPGDIPEDWNDDKWEEHALLGKDYVLMLIYIRISSKTFSMHLDGFRKMIDDNRYSDQDRTKNIKTMLLANKSSLETFEIMLDRLKHTVPEQYGERINP